MFDFGIESVRLWVDGDATDVYFECGCHAETLFGPGEGEIQFSERCEIHGPGSVTDAARLARVCWPELGRAFDRALLDAAPGFLRFRRVPP